MPGNLNTVRGLDGAQGRIRTTDTRIFSPLLYQLSYLGRDDRRAVIGGDVYGIGRGLSRPFLANAA